MGKKLTPKEKLFISHYVKTRNATQSAISAGYSENSAKEIGYENLTKLHIKVEIDKKINALQEKVDLSSEMILRELMRVAFADLKDIMEWDDDGVRIIPSAELEDDQSRVLSEVSSTTTTLPNRTTITNTKAKAYDKLRALELLGKHLKMFTDRTELTGPDGAPIQITNYIDIIKHSLKKKDE